MELTPINVKNMLNLCNNVTIGESTVMAEGVRAKEVFSTAKLNEHKNEILSLLLQLPNIFMKSHGKGASFLKGLDNKDGVIWGDHSDLDNLLILGLATKIIKYNLQRGFWGAFEDGMPYFTVLDT
jgi:hypothetical protein